MVARVPPCRANFTSSPRAASGPVRGCLASRPLPSSSVRAGRKGSWFARSPTARAQSGLADVAVIRGWKARRVHGPRPTSCASLRSTGATSRSAANSTSDRRDSKNRAGVPAPEPRAGRGGYAAATRLNRSSAPQRSQRAKSLRPHSRSIQSRLGGTAELLRDAPASRSSRFLSAAGWLALASSPAVRVD